MHRKDQKIKEGFKMEKIIFYTACRAFGAGVLLMLTLCVLAYLAINHEQKNER